MNTAYKSYRTLPPQAGICALPDAMKSGLSVEQCFASSGIITPSNNTSKKR